MVVAILGQNFKKLWVIWDSNLFILDDSSSLIAFPDELAPFLHVGALSVFICGDSFFNLLRVIWWKTEVWRFTTYYSLQYKNRSVFPSSTFSSTLNIDPSIDGSATSPLALPQAYWMSSQTDWTFDNTCLAILATIRGWFIDVFTK